MMTKAAQLKKIPLFEGLSDAELQQVSACLREKSFQKGEIVFLAGTACERVFIVQSGSVKVYRTNVASGREQVLETLGPGQTCACQPGETDWNCSSSAEALTDCHLLYFSAPDFAKLLHTTPALSMALNRIFSGRIHCLSALVEEVSLKDVRTRVIKFLLDWPETSAGKKPGESLLQISLTREEIARRIGTARETVARTLHQLKEEGYLEILTHQILIKDRVRFEQLLR